MSAPAAIAAVPLLLGVAVGALAHGPEPIALMLLAVAWLAAAASLYAGFGRLLVATSVCGCLAAGVVLGARAAEQVGDPTLLAWFHDAAPAGPVRLTGVLRDDAAITGSGVALTLDVRELVHQHQAVALSGGVRVTVGGTLALAAAREWRQGRIVSLVAALREPVDYRNPGVPSDRERLARQGIALAGSVKSAALVNVDSNASRLDEAASALRAHVRAVTQAAAGRWSPRAAGVVTAILVGDRSGLSPDDERRLQEAGTYHVIAISGGNIALLTLLLVLVGRGLRLPPRATAAGAILFLAFYGYVAGLAASVLRATLAGVVYLAARLLDHRGPALNALAVAAILAVVSAPLSILDPGFALSYGATLAIVVAATRLLRHRERVRGAPRWHQAAVVILLALRALGVATLCAELALAPIGARLFGRISIAGLVLNFVAIPLMSVIQVAGLTMVVSSWASASLASLCGWIAHIATAALIGSASLVDVAPWLVLDVPPPAMWVVTGWYFAWGVLLSSRMFAAAWRRHVIAASTLAVLTCALLMVWAPPPARATHVPPPPPGWARIVFLDVGQGDATLVSPGRGDPLLVDAGGTPGNAFDLGRRVTVPALWAIGVRRLGSLVLTHGDPDHVGGAGAVLHALGPRRVWEGVPIPRHDPMARLQALVKARGAIWGQLRAGDIVANDVARIRVVHPPEADWERRRVRNDDSVVLNVRIGTVEIVLPGDISQDVERTILPHVGSAALVIVKAPHHGSAGSSSAPFIHATHPAAVIFSAGRRNPFGHPAPAVVERYRAAGARVFRTDEDGAIFVDTDGRTAVVWTWGGRKEVLSTADGLSRRPRRNEEHEGR